MKTIYIAMEPKKLLSLFLRFCTFESNTEGHWAKYNWIGGCFKRDSNTPYSVSLLNNRGLSNFYYYCMRLTNIDTAKDQE